MSVYATTETRGEFGCLSCGRVAAETRGGKIIPVRPDYAEMVGRLICPVCRGRLWLQDVHRVTVIGPLSPEDLVTKRGRPPKLDSERASDGARKQAAYQERLRTGETVKRRWARNFDRCVRCQSTESDHNGYGFCNRCKGHRMEAAS